MMANPVNPSTPYVNTKGYLESTLQDVTIQGRFVASGGPLWFTLLDEFLYLVASVIFLIGSWVQMRMWKAQQFGLGFIKEVNEIFKAFERPIDNTQQVALAIYTTTAAICALNLALNNGWHHMTLARTTARHAEPRNSTTASSSSQHSDDGGGDGGDTTAESELLYVSQLLTDLGDWTVKTRQRAASTSTQRVKHRS